MTHRQSQCQRIVVAAFLHDQSEALVAKRSTQKKIAPGKFHLPGGHVEFGEDPAEALTRELYEELRVEVLIHEPLWAFSYLWDGVHTVGVVYRVELLSKRDQIICDEQDIEQYIWTSESGLDRFFNLDNYNFRAAKAGFDRLFAIRRQSEMKNDLN